jgi:type I restriction enzyme S subunit
MGDEISFAPLGSLVDEARGISYGVVQPGQHVDGGVPIVRVTDIRHGRISQMEPLRVAPQIADKYRRTVLRGGELLLTLVGTVGETAVVPASLAGWNTARAVAVLPVLDEPGPRWVQYALQTGPAREYIQTRLNTTVQATLNLGDVTTLPIPMPPREARERSLRILGALDDKIELNRKMNATLEAMARALFKSWFVDFDPVRAKAEGRVPSGMDAETAKLFPSAFVDSELGPIPRAWTPAPVYGIATYVNGAAYKAFQPNDERRGLPIIKIAELKAGVTGQTKFSDVAMPEKYRLRSGDILFSWSGNPDTSIDTFVWAHGEAWLNQHIFRVDLHSPGDRSFVLGTLKFLRPVFAEIARNKQTTGLGHVTAGDMQRLLVVKPDARVLAAWDRVAAPLFATVFRNELEALSLARLRDELLPRLLSGALQVGPLVDGGEH